MNSPRSHQSKRKGGGKGEGAEADQKVSDSPCVRNEKFRSRRGLVKITTPPRPWVKKRAYTFGEL